MADLASSSTISPDSKLVVRTVGKVSQVDTAAWDRLDHGPSPFLKTGFLRALEDSGSIGRRSGWLPVYLLAELDGRLVGAVAAFIKNHSYGEYIFDWDGGRRCARGALALAAATTTVEPTWDRALLLS